MVEANGIEPMTSCLQSTRSPNWATPPFQYSELWWAKEDSNLRPHAYQACALTNWATSPFLKPKNLKQPLKKTYPSLNVTFF